MVGSSLKDSASSLAGLDICGPDWLCPATMNAGSPICPHAEKWKFEPCPKTSILSSAIDYDESRMAMTLDWRVCSRARLSRDARFDGKFYIGVLTSGVYCRPICPAPTAKEKNVRYYPSAAAACQAGFRPCLRCRPECSPGTPAWLGTPNTVARALRLIDESG